MQHPVSPSNSLQTYDAVRAGPEVLTRRVRTPMMVFLGALPRVFSMFYQNGSESATELYEIPENSVFMIMPPKNIAIYSHASHPCILQYESQ